MVKSKQRHTRRPPGKRELKQGPSVVGPPDEDDDWMVVKKQRVTILIPPLPNKVHPIIPSVGEAQLQENPNIIISPSPRKTNSQLQPPLAMMSTSKQSLQETEKSISLSPKQATHPPIALRQIASYNSSLHSHKERKDIGICCSSKGYKRTILFADGCPFLNQRMRASYLERKLKKAGGLENWLVSLGLARFVKVFQRRNVGRFQLSNLTMKKLKDMGTTDAVGPRRKLMHAIDCLCQPHCFLHV